MKKVQDVKVRKISLNLIDCPKEMARVEIDPEYIKELAASIAALGLLQAILVRPRNSRYEIVGGHCRYLAVQLLGWKDIACAVSEMDDTTTVMSRATENLQRAGITAIEEGAIYKSLVEKHGVNIDALAKRMGISPGLVKRRMDLLKMPPQLQKAIHEKKINYGVAEELWSLRDEGALDYYLGFCIDHGATVSVVRTWVAQWKAEQRRKGGDVVGVGCSLSPMESRPVYVACDTCADPMKLGEETVIRCCVACKKAIMAALEKQ